MTRIIVPTLLLLILSACAQQPAEDSTTTLAQQLVLCEQEAEACRAVRDRALEQANESRLIARETIGDLSKYDALYEQKTEELRETQSALAQCQRELVRSKPQTTATDTSGDDCPQMEIPLEIRSSGDGQIIVPGASFSQDGWKLLAADSTGFVMDATAWSCYKGTRPGENVNYFYCGSQLTMSGWSIYIKKTYADSDGTVIKTVKRQFSNVYDQDGEYLRTECGKEI